MQQQDGSISALDQHNTIKENYPKLTEMIDKLRDTRY